MIEAKAFIKQYGPFEPIYTYIFDDGRNINVAANQLRLWCEANKPEIVLLPVDRHLAKRFQHENAISKERAVELAIRMNKRKDYDPIIMCKHDAGNPDALMVDGHHRYFIHAAHNVSFIKSYLLDEKLWRPFQISGLDKLTQKQLKSIPTTIRNY